MHRIHFENESMTSIEPLHTTLSTGTLGIYIFLLKETNSADSSASSNSEPDAAEPSHTQSTNPAEDAPELVALDTNESQ